jgi:hypothetical protein
MDKKPRFEIGQKVWGVYCGGEEVHCNTCGYGHKKLKYVPVFFEINRIIIYSDHIEYGNEKIGGYWGNGENVNFTDYPTNRGVFLTEKEAKKKSDKKNKYWGKK